MEQLTPLAHVECPTCAQVVPPDHKIPKRKVTFCKALSGALIKAFYNAIDNSSQTVHIRYLGLTTSEYARMNDLVRFGLLYKDDSMTGGEYGVPKRRINQFIHNEWTVASHYYKNPVTGENEMSEDRIYFRDVPGVKQLATDLGDRLTSYKHETL